MVGENGGFPGHIPCDIAFGEESGFIVGVFDIIAVKIPDDLSLAVFIQLVDQDLFRGGLGVESGEDDVAVLGAFQQLFVAQCRQGSGDHAIIAFALTFKSLS